MNWFRYIYLKIVGDKCPTCRRKYHDFGNIMMIEQIGECGTCDHVRGDVEHERLEDMAKDEGYASYKDYQESEGLV